MMTDETVTIPKPTDDELRALDKMLDLFCEARDSDHAGDEEEGEVLDLVQALQNKLPGCSV